MAKSFTSLKTGLRLDDLFPFGKYKDALVEDAVVSDPGYIFWAVANTDVQFSKETLIRAIKEHVAILATRAKPTKYKPDKWEGYPDGYGTGTDPWGFEDVPF